MSDLKRKIEAHTNAKVGPKTVQAIKASMISGFDWSKLWVIVQQYGPSALQIIEQLLNSGHPMPDVPTPPAHATETPEAKTPEVE